MWWQHILIISALGQSTRLSPLSKKQSAENDGYHLQSQHLKRSVATGSSKLCNEKLSQQVCSGMVGESNERIFDAFKISRAHTKSALSIHLFFVVVDRVLMQ